MAVGFARGASDGGVGGGELSRSVCAVAVGVRRGRRRRKPASAGALTVGEVVVERGMRRDGFEVWMRSRGTGERG